MNIRGVIGRAALGVAALLGAQQAQAVGTTADTTVTNEVTVNYAIAGVNQPEVKIAATFKVDRKILITVAETGNGATSPVAPGQQNVVTAFTVTNNSNAFLDLQLAAANKATAAPTAHGAGTTDNQDVTLTGGALGIYLDNGNGAYDPGTDTPVTYLDEVAADQTLTVLIVAAVPMSAANGEIASVSLRATALEGNGGTTGTMGAAITETTAADNVNAMDTVFADTAGAATGDAARDGSHSDDDDYNIQVTAITVNKASRVISDPVNLTGNGTTIFPKAIPEAVIEYCIVVANPGASAVSNVAVSDPMPAEVLYSAETIFSVPTATNTTNCFTDAGTAEDDDTTDESGDESVGFGASYDAGNTRVLATIPALAASGSTALRFRVTVK